MTLWPPKKCLYVAMLFLAIGLVAYPLTKHYRSVAKQREAVKAISRTAYNYVGYPLYSISFSEEDSGQRPRAVNEEAEPAILLWLLNCLGADVFSDVYGVAFHSLTGVGEDRKFLNHDLEEMCPHLEALESLEVLDLSGTHVTNSGLTCLSKCKKLRFLLLHNSQVTQEGVSMLKKHLPDVRGFWEPSPL